MQIVTDGIALHKNIFKCKEYKVINIAAYKKKASNKKIIPVVGLIDNIKYIFPSKHHQTIETLYYKDKFAKFMNEYFSNCVPPTYFDDKQLIFPTIMKPIDGCAGYGIIIFKNKGEYENSKIKFNNTYIIQEYVCSAYITTGHFLCDSGNILWTAIYTSKSAEYVIKRGAITNYTKRNLSENEINVFSDILKKLNYHGLCCIDYCIDNNDKIKIFEINPRIGGSLVNDTTDFTLLMEFIKKTNYSFSSL